MKHTIFPLLTCLSLSLPTAFAETGTNSVSIIPLPNAVEMKKDISR